ncbi:glutamate-cysteine ligase, catalytic subunit domain-containing protein, partial [Cardiosporidium cionae]
GKSLDWKKDLEILDFIKEAGVEQFIALFQRHAGRSDPPESIKWGEEIEFLLVQFDDDRREAYVYPQAPAIINRLEQMERCMPETTTAHGTSWHDEYSSFAVEAVPRNPYPLDLNSVLLLQKSMCYRRWKLKTVVPVDVDVSSLSSFPLLGSSVFLKDTKEKQKHRVANSLFLPDEIISSHPRFSSLTRNIYLRRGKKVQIFVPLYIDENTHLIEWDSADSFNQQKSKCAISPENDTDITQSNPVQNSIYMDAMGFGMGMGCCQATYMCNGISSARYLYDQFCVLSPLWL